MEAGLKSLTAVGKSDYLVLFTQSGLEVPNHQGDVNILLQNYCYADMEISRCTATGLLENLQNDTFN
jgi:hypothetical protein